MLTVLSRALPDLRARLDRELQRTPRPLLVAQEAEEAAGGPIQRRLPYRYLLEHSASVNMVVIVDDPREGLWRDPMGDLADRLFPDRRLAVEAAAGYILLFADQQPDYVRRDIWDRHADVRALVLRLDLDIPLPPRPRAEEARRAHRRAHDASSEDEIPTDPGNTRRNAPAFDDEVTPPPRARRTRRADTAEQPRQAEPPRPPPEPPAPDPFQQLGLQPGASEDEVKKAFRALIIQYHPDKVAHLAPEFRELAERRSRELTAAYDLAQKLARGEEPAK